MTPRANALLYKPSSMLVYIVLRMELNELSRTYHKYLILIQRFQLEQ